MMTIELSRDECRKLLPLLKKALRWALVDPLVLDLYRRIERGAAEVSDEKR